MQTSKQPQAGEHGRRFAVVADEVSKLAEQSTEWAQQIPLLVQPIHSEIHNVIRDVEKGIVNIIDLHINQPYDR